MEWTLLFIGVLVFLELAAGFVYYPWKHGSSYYRHRLQRMFRFDPLTGYSWQPNFAVRKPPTALPNAPRRILDIDFRVGKEGFLFLEDIHVLREHSKLIFCLGGSTTAGRESRYNRTYPAVLDEFVQPFGYRAINAGVGGYRAIHERLFFQHRILPYNPDVLILFSGYNDFEDAAYPYYSPRDPFAHCLEHSLPVTRWQNSLDQSALLHVMRYLPALFLGRIRLESVPIDFLKRLTQVIDEGLWLNEWKENVGQILDGCKSRGIRCYLLSHLSPVFESASDSDKDLADQDLNMCGRYDIFLNYLQKIEKAVETLCKEKEVEYLDIRHGFEKYCAQFAGPDYARRRYELFADRQHFTEKGNALLAELVFKGIRRDI
jgi:lysophospholipase L1-like esterase